ncbi:MAG: YihY/virulence factor BrkB family protein [Firmicutes bacterium]|nr:YihY/virulence factor BrkB family protein [Bacillota bacterium]
MKSKMARTSFIVLNRLKDPYYQGAAAELGFYLLFSIVPIITLLFHFLSVTDTTVELVRSISQEFAKNELVSTVLEAIGDMNGGISIAFLIPALWAASKFEFSLMRMADYTYGFGDRNAVRFIKNRLRAIVTIAGLIIAICLGLIVLVYGDMLFHLLNVFLDQYLGLALHIDQILKVLKWPLAMLIYVVFIAINYSILPMERIPFKKTIPGSIFAASGFIIVSVGYYAYFYNFSKFNMIYGSFAAVVALLLWFYLIGFIMVVGMLINAAWYEESAANAGFRRM